MSKRHCFAKTADNSCNPRVQLRKNRYLHLPAFLYLYLEYVFIKFQKVFICGKKSLLTLLLTLPLQWLMWGEVQAQTPKYSNEFLSIGVGARALGMSNAFVSLANDATAGYWNPAGLPRLQANAQIALMHTQYFAGIAQYDYGTLAFNNESGNALGISWIRFGVDDIPDTSELIDSEGNINYDRIRSFSASDNALLLSWGRRINPQLNVGINAKIIRRTAGTFAGAWGFGLDAGIIYHWAGWQWGAIARDITSTFNAWTYDLDERMREVFTLTGNEIPENSMEITLPSLVLGASRYFAFTPYLGLTASADLAITTDGKRNVLIKGDPFSIDPALGLELNFKEVVFLRAGMGNYQQYTRPNEKQTHSLQLNMGLGVQIGNRLALDYALTDVGDNSIALYSNIFSLRFSFNRQERN